MLNSKKIMRSASLSLILLVGIAHCPLEAKQHHRQTVARKAINVICYAIFCAGSVAGMWYTTPNRKPGQSLPDYLKSFKSLPTLTILSLLGCGASATISALNIVDTIQS